MKRYMFVLGMLIGVILLYGGTASSGKKMSNKFNPVSRLAQSGDIKGQITYCGADGHEEILVWIPGASFNAWTNKGGEFRLYSVPSGKYNLRIRKAGQATLTIGDVTVKKKEITELGEILYCPCLDEDADEYGQGPGCLGEDCDDTDENVNPGAEEICEDDKDNNCDGEVDEGC